MVIVRFPEYSGPPIEGCTDSKLVAISPCEVRCEKRCCTRTGFPLVCGKAETIHKCQGSTIGEGHALERIVIHWEKDMEVKMQGLFYTSTSRATDSSAAKLDFTLTRDDIKSLCGGQPNSASVSRHSRRTQQRRRTRRKKNRFMQAEAECERLTNLAIEQQSLREADTSLEARRTFWSGCAGSSTPAERGRRVGSRAVKPQRASSKRLDRCSSSGASRWT